MLLFFLWASSITTFNRIKKSVRALWIENHKRMAFLWRRFYWGLLMKSNLEFFSAAVKRWRMALYLKRMRCLVTVRAHFTLPWYSLNLIGWRCLLQNPQKAAHKEAHTFNILSILSILFSKEMTKLYISLWAQYFIRKSYGSSNN